MMVDDPLALLFRLLLDAGGLLVLLRLAYLPRGGHPGRLLTLVVFNVVIFLIAYLLNRVEITMGAAFGLFAVFSLLRYRTEGISARDMTYLFLAIALGLLLAVAAVDLWMLAGVAALLPLLALLLESEWVARQELAHDVVYDNVRLLAPSERPALLADLRARTGLAIDRVDIQRIDLLKEVAYLTVYGPRA